MHNDITWQLLDTKASLSSGLLLSRANNAFIIKDLKDNSVFQTLEFKEFISDKCKYPCEIFALIKNKLSCSFDCKTIFYDSFASETIIRLCESNRLLF